MCEPVCGKPAIPGGAWCPEHRAVAYSGTDYGDRFLAQVVSNYTRERVHNAVRAAAR
jgi:hypothetical protein